MEHNNSSTKRKYDDNDTNSEDNSIPIILDNDDEQKSIKKQKTKKNVRFDDVTVYYFARSQGFVSVPSQGTVTLGMVHEHSHVEQYSVTDFLRLRRGVHKSILRERKLLPPSTTSAVDSDTDEDEPLPVDDYYFVQPITTRQRRTLLKQAGLVKIDTTEKHELTLIRRSREVCGCSCTREMGGCQPLTCECYLNGIACQVDRLTFPCPCATMICKNPLGRLEFNQNRVRNHFVQTITRLEAERKLEECGLECSNNTEDEIDDVSIAAFILSSIISEIEYEEDVILSILDNMVSSVCDSLSFMEESSPPSLLCNIETNISDDTLDSSSEEYLNEMQHICHINSTQSCINQSLLSSTTIIRTESS